MHRVHLWAAVFAINGLRGGRLVWDLYHINPIMYRLVSSVRRTVVLGNSNNLDCWHCLGGGKRGEKDWKLSNQNCHSDDSDTHMNMMISV